MRTCSADGCDRPHYAKGWCSKHYKRNPATRLLEAMHGPANHRWSGDTCGYVAAHRRVVRAKGKACTWWCSHCDNRASDWAYDGEDPNEQVGEKRGKIMAYSPDPNHYFPLCRSCHVLMDKRKKVMPSEQHRV